MRKVLFQQGDLIIYKADKIPEGAKEIKIGKRFTLLKGEGVNTHDLINVNGEVKGYEKDGVLYLKVNSSVPIEHQEHGIEEIPPGIGYKDVEQTFDYEAMEARNTKD